MIYALALRLQDHGLLVLESAGSDAADEGASLTSAFSGLSFFVTSVLGTSLLGTSLLGTSLLGTSLLGTSLSDTCLSSKPDEVASFGFKFAVSFACVLDR